MTDKEVVILVGNQCSGKSTLCKTDPSLHPHMRVSQDDSGKEGHKILYQKMLKSGITHIVVDRINHIKEQRSYYLDLARQFGYKTRIITTHVPYAVAYDRIQKREGHPTLKAEDAHNALKMFFSQYEYVQDNEADVVERSDYDPFLLDLTEKVKVDTVLLVGDVHGCYDELIQLTKKHSGPIILAGDLCDRGPKIKEVFDWAMNTPNVHVVMSNHDNKLLRALRGNPVRSPDILKSLKDLEGIDKEKLRMWLESLPYAIKFRENSYVMHAGIVPIYPVERQSREHLIYTRTWNPITKSFVSPNAEGWYTFGHQQKIYFGHNIHKNTFINDKTVSLDGGCVHGGVLRGVLSYTDGRDEVVEIAPKELYYEDKGLEDIYPAPRVPFEQKVKEGYISKQYDGDLVLYNYTDKCTYDRMWDETTMQARGLVMNADTGEIVARPLSKFFNISEHETTFVANLPRLPYEVTDKADGCFTHSTPLNLWDGGTIRIGDIVSKKLNPVLVGMNKNGKIIPCRVTKRFNNGTKNNWLSVEIDCLPSKLSGSRTGNHLRVTENHKVYANDKWTIAGNLNIGDKVVNFLDTYDFYSEKIIQAHLLGDGSICKTNNSCKFMWVQKFNKKDYIKSVQNKLGNTLKSRTIKSGFGTRMTQLVSPTLKSLNGLRKKWYPNGKKIVPKDLSWVDDEVVAIWYMDDGSRSHSSSQRDRARFHTNGFKRSDCKRLSNLLQNKYGVSCSVLYQKGWTICVNAGRDKKINNFWRAIAPHITRDMEYKLPINFRNRSKRKLKVGSLNKERVEVSVLSIKKIPNTRRYFPSGRVGFDIETTTHNFFAKGILVHNSLGIIYNDKGKWRINTRGSFSSEQAKRATEIFDRKYRNKFNEHADPGQTVLAEIIYPENRFNEGARLVSDYGSMEDLILIAVTNRKTGDELPYSQLMGWAKFFGMPLVNRFDHTIQEMIELQKTLPKTREGFVVKYSNGLRVKIKGDEYCKMQKILNSVSPLSVWEVMKDGKVPDEYIVGLPEEIRPEIDRYKEHLEGLYKKVEGEIREDFETHFPFASVGPEPTKETRKLVGLRVKELGKLLRHPPATFPFMLAKPEDLDRYLKKMIRPTSNVMS